MDHEPVSARIELARQDVAGYEIPDAKPGHRSHAPGFARFKRPFRPEESAQHFAKEGNQSLIFRNKR